MILTVNDNNTYSINEPDKILAFVSGDAWLDGDQVKIKGALNYLTVQMRGLALLSSTVNRVTFTWFKADNEDNVEKIKETMKQKVMELENK